MRAKTDQKSIKKSTQKWSASWHRFLVDFGRFLDLSWGRKSTKNRSKNRFVFLSFFASVLVPFWVPKRSPKMIPICRGGGPWGVHGGPGLVLVRSCVRLVARVRFFDPLALLFGAILGPFWVILGLSWAILGPSWALWEPSWGHLGPILRHLRAILADLGATWGLSSVPRGSFGILWVPGSLGPLVPGSLGPLVPLTLGPADCA